MYKTLKYIEKYLYRKYKIYLGLFTSNYNPYISNISRVILEVQKSEQSLSFIVFSNIVLNSIKFYLKVYFCKNKSEAELIYLCGNVLKTLFWFYSLYRNMAKLSQEHFRSLYIHIHNQTHTPVKDIPSQNVTKILIK